MNNNVSYNFTQTGAEPLTTTDVKNYLRISDTNDDTLVGALITASRSVAEKYLNKLIVQNTVTMTLDYFPGGGMRLPYGPVQSVTSIQVTDNSTPGVQTTWASSNYLVDVPGQRIVWADAAVFPSTMAQINGVQVTYVAGYGLATDITGIPSGIIQGLRHLIATSYENREVPVDLPPLVKTLLSPFKKLVI
jgi:uncharacterized phiE125 gp8 family phage protein